MLDALEDEDDDEVVEELEAFDEPHAAESTARPNISERFFMRERVATHALAHHGPEVMVEVMVGP